MWIRDKTLTKARSVASKTTRSNELLKGSPVYYLSRAFAVISGDGECPPLAPSGGTRSILGRTGPAHGRSSILEPDGTRAAFKANIKRDEACKRRRCTLVQNVLPYDVLTLTLAEKTRKFCLSLLFFYRITIVQGKSFSCRER